MSNRAGEASHGREAKNIKSTMTREARSTIGRRLLAIASTRIKCAVLLAACLAIISSVAFAQGSKMGRASTRNSDTAKVGEQETGYGRPDFRQRLRNYEVSTFGPAQMTTVIFGAAISQADNVPPEWRQGWGAYGERLASHFGSTAVSGTTNFALGEALRLDTKYYPCTCKGIWPRLRYAFLSSVTARAGEDGHRVFSPPAIVSPYAGAFAMLGWYPARYRAEDAFRTGNYNFLDSVGMKIALEFLHPVMKKLRWARVFGD